MDHVELQLTEDGSHTLFNSAINETYHSHKGALAESKYVFIHAGMDAMLEQVDALSMLEVGFGTGLNALMTLLRAKAFAKVQSINIRYVTIEPFPLDKDLIEKLNYKAMLPPEAAPLFDALHNAPWDQDVEMIPGFILHKVHGRLEDYQGKADSINLVYYDAFAPNKQPDVWTGDNFRKCFVLMQTGGMLVSYCANGQFKRDLKAVGFKVKPYPGALGKREMTRAWKIAAV